MIRRAAAALALASVFAPAAPAADAVPAYALPEGYAAERLPESRDEGARAAVASILDPGSQDEGEDAVRVLAGLGAGALPRIVAALPSAAWPSRAAFVAAIGEMGDATVTPVLVTAAADPAFAVREAAVTGLGKSGDARGATSLAERASALTEPSWRVRAAAAAALRRAVLRGTVVRTAGETLLVRLLADEDEDVRHAALVELAPLAADAALSAILAVFEDATAPAFERTAALTALRAYRSPRPELLAALRRGFLSGDDPSSAIEAGRALLAIRGVAALDDDEISEAVVHRLFEADHEALRDGLARLGRAAAPWLRREARRVAERIASARARHGETSFDELLDTLIQVDEESGLEFVTEVLAGGEGRTLDSETRLAVLQKVELVYAPRMQAELRSLFDGPSGENLRPQLLRAIVASGGLDLAARLDAALANESVREKALELLNRRADLPAGPRLLALAREAAAPRLRRQAIDTLSRRDPAGAARVVADLVDDPHADLRSLAFTVLSNSRDPADFDRLVARLSAEDGSDVRPAKAASDAAPSATTPTDHVRNPALARRRMLKVLVPALKTSGGARAHPVLLRVVEGDADADVRGCAAESLRGIAAVEDAPRLAAAEGVEPDPNTRRQILSTLATLGGAPAAEARFAALVAEERTRSEALRLLGEPGACVVPPVLGEGLLSAEWTDEDRVAALSALTRAGRAPSVAVLGRLVAESRTLELCDAAARALAASPGPEATAELIALVAKTPDPERLSFVVAGLGSRRAPEAEAPLLDLFARTRDAAVAARLAADPSVELYRRAAEAVAEFGSERTGAALVDHLLDPRLGHAVARARSPRGGPLAPFASAPVTLSRMLVAALARRDEATCRRLVASKLDALAASGRDVALPEAYTAGLARYLRQPLAYGLPARPRAESGALLWSLVPRTAPRLSELDADALQAADDACAEARRFADAAAALRRLAELSDVEHAARSIEERQVLECRIRVRDAQALAASGDLEGALSIARSLRDADPSSGELAYRQGWCLARLGQTGAETRDALLFAAAQDDKDARIAFQIAWVTESSEGPGPALPAYDRAIALDRRRVELRNDEDLGGGNGAAYETAAYPYWFARALAADRQPAADVADWLAKAVELDDRFAVLARSDPAFRGLPDLDAAIAAGLARIRSGALR